MSPSISEKNKTKLDKVKKNGINIAETVDIEKVKEVLKDYPGTGYVTDYKYMCFDTGQDLIKQI